ncbi:unnamed protein product [Darwinula stevensoni]|uniref:Uncharacterized protein n=1 Tax=Darwinula stevensoni TaxID=69355 RepID=A0A7R9A6X5_9CRUS|nr:unnamed protein product [Darwinula stevensoni]CAG0889276.1 unnamed protein product [Darwinula stevensoni]
MRVNPRMFPWMCFLYVLVWTLDGAESQGCGEGIPIEDLAFLADTVVSARVLTVSDRRITIEVIRAKKGVSRRGESLDVRGLENPTLCEDPSGISPGGYRIWFLKEDAEDSRRYLLLASPMRLTLDNLDRVNAAIRGE